MALAEGLVEEKGHGEPLLNTGHREICLELSWKLPPFWLVFTVLEGSNCLLGKKSHQQHYPAMNSVFQNDPSKMSLLVQYSHNCYGDNYFPVSFGAYITGRNLMSGPINLVKRPWLERS